MNRSFKLMLTTALLAAGVVSTAQAAEMKIGVVNYSRLLQESPQAKTALDGIRAEFAPREREIQNQGTALKAREERLQKDAATMTEVQRSGAEKELRDGYRELQKKQAEVQDDFNARRNEEMSRLQRTLVEEVQAFAKAQSYDLILADGVIFVNPAIDITGAVLTSLQAKRGGGAATPARPVAKP